MTTTPLSTLLPLQRYFVTGIDTDCGKTYCTGTLSKQLLSEGCRVITQKLIQTGCPDGVSEDIIEHRRIEGRDLTPFDHDGTTCPLVYSYPCSPHMAVVIDGAHLNLDLAHTATERLAAAFDKVLIEGAGGMMVPLTERYLTIDYIIAEQLPVLLVTTARLGSINHTLLNIKVLQHHGITLAALIYNRGLATDERITTESERYLRSYLQELQPSTLFIGID